MKDLLRAKRQPEDDVAVKTRRQALDQKRQELEEMGQELEKKRQELEKKRQDVKEVTDELSDMTARSEVLKLELQQLEEQVVEKKRGEQLAVCLGIDDVCAEEEVSGDGTAAAFDSMFMEEVPAEQTLFEFDFAYDF